MADVPSLTRLACIQRERALSLCPTPSDGPTSLLSSTTSRMAPTLATRAVYWDDDSGQSSNVPLIAGLIGGIFGLAIVGFIIRLAIGGDYYGTGRRRQHNQVVHQVSRGHTL